VVGVLIASLAMQLVAAALALRLVRKTVGAWGWILIAVAMVLMASRRAVTLVELIRGNHVRFSLTAEAIAAAISILMVAGVALIGSVFARLQRAELEVRHRERDMREILDSTPDGIVLARDGRWVYANPTAALLLGLDPATPETRRALAEVAPDPDRARLERGPLAAEAARGDAVELRLTEIDPPRTVEIVAGPRLEHEGSLARLLVVRDLTERKALEEQLLQSQKLEALGRMAGGIAHDFNNLLTVVVASTGFVKRRLPAADPSLEWLADIELAAGRGAALTAQLLAFSRHGAARMELIDVGQVVDALRTLLRTMLGSEIELELALAPGLPAVRGDRSQVEQVLINLIVNARDAMPDGGQVVVSTRTVQLDRSAAPPWSDAPAGTYVVMGVVDQGVGIEPEVQVRIFDPFFTTKSVGKGSGLGLATCYAIARRLGGGMRLTTALRKGSTFELWLPAAEGQAARPGSAPEQRPHEAATAAILVVDDEAMIRTLAGRLLCEEGYQVVEASSGEEALAVLAARGGIRLVVTDLVMPGMSGFELIERVRRDHPRVEILVTSGYADGLAGREDLDVVNKPYTPEVLAARVRGALARREGRAASPKTG